MRPAAIDLLKLSKRDRLSRRALGRPTPAAGDADRALLSGCPPALDKNAYPLKLPPSIKATRRVTGPNEYTRRHKGLEGGTLWADFILPRPACGRLLSEGRGEGFCAETVRSKVPLTRHLHAGADADLSPQAGRGAPEAVLSVLH